MKYAKVQEEELKNKVAQDFFGKFDCTEIIEKIDFAVKRPGKHLAGTPANEQYSAGTPAPDSYFLWAEAKAAQTDVCEMLTQLVLTIGKARTFDKITPPSFLGCFDREKIAFVPYHAVQEIFYQNDFNWKVTPSKRDTPQFKQVYALIKSILDSVIPAPSVIPTKAGIQTKDERPVSLDPRLRGGDESCETYIFDFEKDADELKRFIRENFIIGKSDITKTRIDKNNFIAVYLKWLEMVKPTIAGVNWEHAKKSGIIDGDFYLADLLSRENETLKEKLFVLLQSNHYKLDRKIDDAGFIGSREAHFTDNQKAHLQFWAIYERPPLEEYWDYLIERRDMLVPQDVRERKGSFFTPRIWVELSQQYLADVFGANWQDEYYIWDCAAGTGNLLAGLTNKYNIWASTLDKADVDVMHDRIENGANLLKDHVFQFDFLNDDFSTLPKGLQDIINDENERKKLIIYINPPYAEAGDTKQRGGTGKNKDKVATDNQINKRYGSLMGKAANELFALFFMRFITEIPDAKLASFSTLKYLGSQNFVRFRESFLAEYKGGFICPANTFDNVNGFFPIGFLIWDTSNKKKFRKTKLDAFDRDGCFLEVKTIHNIGKAKPLTLFTKTERNENAILIGHFAARGCDFQNQQAIFIDNLEKEKMGGGLHVIVSDLNLIDVAISFTVRHCIEYSWLNNRDQFLYPSNKWKEDIEFQNDCLAYTLFHNKNTIQSKHGVNHWIPFLESEVNARDKFDSHFMRERFLKRGGIALAFSVEFLQNPFLA